MDLISGGKKGGKRADVEDTIKILATNLEVLNQKLAMSSIGSQDGFPQMENHLNAISAKIDYTINFIKSVQDNLQQHFIYSDAKFTMLDNNIKKVQSEIKGQIDIRHQEMRSLVSTMNSQMQQHVASISDHSTRDIKNQFATGIGTISHDLQSHKDAITRQLKSAKIDVPAEVTDQVQKNNAMMSDILDEFKVLKKDLPQKVAQIDLKVNKLHEVLSKGLAIAPGSKGKPVPLEAHVPEEVINDIQFIRSELEVKFQDISTQIYRLLKINKELIDYMKEQNL